MSASIAPEWLDVPDDVNALPPHVWPAGTTRNKAGALVIDGVSAPDVGAEFGTPVYVMSETEFRSRARLFRDAFRTAFEPLGTGVDVYYASKAFSCVAAARWIAEEGLSLDTASGGELAIGLRAGVPPERIALHGNNKSDAELRRALDAGIGRIVVDSLPELDRLDAIAGEMGVVAPVMLRLTPGVHAHTHDFIATAHEDQKFGLSLSSTAGAPSPASQAVAAALAAHNLELTGVHCHIGSQIFEPEGFEAAAQRLLSFLAEVKAEHDVELAQLDLGGGHGIAYLPGETPRSPDEIASATAATVGETCQELGLSVPHISIEPGRAIAGPSGVTLYTVGTIKDVTVSEGASRRYVSVDGGMSDNARPVLYDADYTAVLANRTSDAEPTLCRVVGKHCESGDIVVRDVYLPADLRAGDLLAVPATGAYCYSLSSNYNQLPRPGVVAIADGTARTIVRAETEEDLFARDVEA